MMSNNTERPYEFQVPSDRWPDDGEIDAWMNAVNAPVFNLLVGPPKCGKSTFIINYGLQSRGSKATVSRSAHGVSDPLIEINIVDKYWSEEELDSCIVGDESVVIDKENLTRKEREKILRKIPSHYWKVAIIWELSDDELLHRGCSQSQIEEKDVKYERPDTDENFDELVYIFS